MEQNDAVPKMRFKKGDWVYRFIGSYQNPFRCEVVGFGETEEPCGFFKTKKVPRYILQVPGQEWKIYGGDDGSMFCAATQSELFNRE